MNSNNPSPETPNETLNDKAARLETEALRLFKDTEQRLNSEKDPRIRELLDMRLQELKNILVSLKKPMEQYIATTEARIETLRGDPLSVGTHEFLLNQPKIEQPQNLAQPADLETEVVSLIKETEQLLKQEGNPLTQELLGMRLQDLKGILASLRVPKVKGRARIQAQLQLIREEQIPVDPPIRSYSVKKTEQPGNGAHA